MIKTGIIYLLRVDNDKDVEVRNIYHDRFYISIVKINLKNWSGAKGQRYKYIYCDKTFLDDEIGITFINEIVKPSLLKGGKIYYI